MTFLRIIYEIKILFNSTPLDWLESCSWHSMISSNQTGISLGSSKSANKIMSMSISVCVGYQKMLSCVLAGLRVRGFHVPTVSCRLSLTGLYECKQVNHVQTGNCLRIETSSDFFTDRQDYRYRTTYNTAVDNDQFFQTRIKSIHIGQVFADILWGTQNNLFVIF